ncbi:unnamed protein product [Rotaria sordida]|uniref:ADP ribosyltransferase domain-containing protein n=1 Tax=Rotaria sordida TaxID=392033 RepID=A0A815NDW1_9BILA|nr:unnamed protein product [Rotaria sordida]
MNKCDKIIKIYTDKKSLFKSTYSKMNLIKKGPLTFNLFDEKQKSLKDLSKESASFLWQQMLIYVLKQIPQNEQSKQQMVDFCLDYYKNNKSELEKIKNFKTNYNRDQAIEWYTKEGFLYKLLNKVLRTEDIELFYTFRFFIIDLCIAIENANKHVKDKDLLTLYRGTQIPKEELQKLKENINRIISFNGFLSTSRNINISLQFACSSYVTNNFEAVLFEIQADPLLKTVSFVDVESAIVMKGEEEVLFNLNSLFRINSVCFDEATNLWKVLLTTTDEGSSKVEDYLKLAKEQMEYYSPTIYFGRLLLFDLGLVNSAEKYFKVLLNSFSSDYPDIAHVYNNIGSVYEEKRELNLALENYEIAYKIRQKCLSVDHPDLAASSNNIGQIYQEKGKFDLALDYYKKALKIKEQTSPGDSLHKGVMIQNIGLVYKDKNDFDRALNHLSCALEMFKHILPDQHPQIALCLGNIGYIYKEKGAFDAALDYYHQQLKMEEQCLMFDHPSLSLTLQSIVDTYKKMGEVSKGLEFCREKLVVQKNRLHENHSCIARTLMITANIVKDNNPNEALEYYEKALSILKDCTPFDYQTTSKCLEEMACIYRDFGSYEDAVRNHLKALEFKRQILSADHIEIASSLNTIGLCYRDMENPFEALCYYNESLSIYLANYGLEHEDVKQVKANIVALNIL